MSHFEYVAVAIALVHSLVVGRLLTGLTPSLEKSRRYPIHVAWILTLLLVCILSWWGLWRVSDVAWTAARFLSVLALPAVLFVQAGILVGPASAPVESYRVHFFERRRSFFALSVLGSVLVIVLPWVSGITPWFEAAPAQPAAVTLGALSLAGLVLQKETIHVLIVALSAFIVAAAFYLIPAPAAA